MSWVKRVKAAFQKLKNLNVKNQEVKQWGVNVVTQLLRIVGLDGEQRPGSCGPRRVEIEADYYGHLVVHMRVPYCSDADIGLMWQAVRILETEAVALTPVDTGLLKKSRYREVQLENAGKTVRGTYGYDVINVRRTSNTGRTTYYALAVHNRDANHTQGNNPPRATWKFLEKAITNRAILSQIQDLFK